MEEATCLERSPSERRTQRAGAPHPTRSRYLFPGRTPYIVVHSLITDLRTLQGFNYFFTLPHNIHCSLHVTDEPTRLRQSAPAFGAGGWAAVAAAVPLTK